MIYYANEADMRLDGEVETKVVGHYVTCVSLSDFNFYRTLIIHLERLLLDSCGRVVSHLTFRILFRRR